MLKRLAAAMLALAAVCSFSQGFALSTQAQSAVLIDGGTGKVLYAKNAHERLPMASTTKIMTALIAIEHGDLDELVTVDASAYGVEGSSIYLQLEESISLRDLLYGLMLSSGNDSAVAIAVHVGQSSVRFASMMNARARELGALNTNFVTPNGLHDPEHYTTAYDLALIAAEAMKNETFREIVKAEYHRTTTGAVQRTFKNKNRLLWEYDGGNGVKTGYTKAAGKCLAFSAEREGMQLIGVVLNCPNMFEEAKNMMDRGFEEYERATLLRAGETVAIAGVLQGQKNMLELTVQQDIMITVKKGESLTCRTRVLFDENIAAPIEKGEALGRVEVLDEGALISSTPLIAANDVEKADVRWYFDRIARRFAG